MGARLPRARRRLFGPLTLGVLVLAVIELAVLVLWPPLLHFYRWWEVRGLTSQWNDPDPKVHAAAVSRLVEIDRDDAQVVLYRVVEELRNGSATSRVHASHLLRRLSGLDYRRYVALLVEALDDPSDQVSAVALMELVGLAGYDSALTAEIRPGILGRIERELMSVPAPQRVLLAHVAIAWSEPDVRLPPILSKLLHDEDPEVELSTATSMLWSHRWELDAVERILEFACWRPQELRRAVSPGLLEDIGTRMPRDHMTRWLARLWLAPSATEREMLVSLLASQCGHDPRVRPVLTTRALLDGQLRLHYARQLQRQRSGSFTLLRTPSPLFPLFLLDAVNPLRSRQERLRSVFWLLEPWNAAQWEEWGPDLDPVLSRHLLDTWLGRIVSATSPDYIVVDYSQ